MSHISLRIPLMSHFRCLEKNSVFVTLKKSTLAKALIDRRFNIWNKGSEKGKNERERERELPSKGVRKGRGEKTQLAIVMFGVFYPPPQYRTTTGNVTLLIHFLHPAFSPFFTT